jgi:hypothetical protein
MPTTRSFWETPGSLEPNGLDILRGFSFTTKHRC